MKTTERVTIGDLTIQDSIIFTGEYTRITQNLSIGKKSFDNETIVINSEQARELFNFLKEKYNF